MKVQNMVNNNGNKVENQFILISEEFEIFQSYDSIIAKKYNSGLVELSEHYDYSKTTMKYLNLFLGHNIQVTRDRIDSGAYKVNLSI